MSHSLYFQTNGAGGHEVASLKSEIENLKNMVNEKMTIIDEKDTKIEGLEAENIKLGNMLKSVEQEVSDIVYLK